MENNTQYIEEELETIDAPLWWHLQGLSYTASGYGAKIPLRIKVLYNKRYYRVYVMIYSNIGTSYIIVKGIKLILRQH